MRPILILAAAVFMLAACGQSQEAAESSSPEATIAATNPPPAAAAAVTPAQVREAVARDGAAATVAAFSAGDGPRMRTVEKGIASGEQAWLDVFPLIYPGADGESAIGLKFSLTDALTTNAAGALRAAQAGDADELQGVCSAYEMMDLGADRDQVFARAISAVEAIAEPSLAADKAACLAALKSSQASPAQ